MAKKARKLSGVQSARKAVSTAKAAYKKGTKGSGTRLDKAIDRYAKAKAKSICGTK